VPKGRSLTHVRPIEPCVIFSSSTVILDHRLRSSRERLVCLGFCSNGGSATR
jgi:hypothetical protein